MKYKIKRHSTSFQRVLHVVCVCYGALLCQKIYFQVSIAARIFFLGILETYGLPLTV